MSFSADITESLPQIRERSIIDHRRYVNCIIPIEKGPLAPNNAMVHFGGEGLPYVGSSLLLQGNTFVNDKGAATIGVLNQSGLPVTITANTFTNLAAARIVSGPATLTGNKDASGNPITDGTTTGLPPGSFDFSGDALDHAITLQGGLVAVRGGAGYLTVTAIAGHVAANGGAGGMTFNEGPTSGGNTVVTVAGSTNTINVHAQDAILSQGTDAIVTGTGNITGTLAGNAIVSSGAGDNTWTVTGAATIAGGAGSTFISVSPTGSAAIGHVRQRGGNSGVE